MSENKNPLFVEYYSHLGCDCYKILNPWTRYRANIVVLCPVEEGIEVARKLAKRELRKRLNDALNQPLEPTKDKLETPLKPV